MIDHLTPEATRAVRTLVDAVAEAIRDLGEVPSGHLYAQLMGYVNLQQYEAIISLLIDQRRVKRDASHLLRWIGPKEIA